MRALLDLMRENEEAVQVWAVAFQGMLEYASRYHKILDPRAGETELIKAVAAALARLKSLSRPG